MEEKVFNQLMLSTAGVKELEEAQKWALKEVEPAQPQRALEGLLGDARGPS